MKQKYLDQLRTKTRVVLHDREATDSPIDNCSLFIRHEENKSQATSYKYTQAMQPFPTAI